MTNCLMAPGAKYPATKWAVRVQDAPPIFILSFWTICRKREFSGFLAR